MKAIYLTIQASLLLLSTTLILSSCNKDNSDPDVTVLSNGSPNAVPPDSFFAKIDGVEFEETLFWANEVSASNYILIGASEDGSLPSIGLTVSNDVAPGVYPFSSIMPYAAYNVANLADSMYNAAAGTGQMIILVHDQAANYIEGNFNFVASPSIGSSSTNTYSVTEGNFAISY